MARTSFGGFAISSSSNFSLSVVLQVAESRKRNLRRKATAEHDNQVLACAIMHTSVQLELKL
jgi:hypothetical protein